MKKRMKQIIIFILILIFLCIVGYGLLLGYKYLNHKEIIGEYELLDHNSNNKANKLKISVYKWTKGNNRNLKCDLWNCTGYDYGTYEISDNKINLYLKAKTIFNNNSSGLLVYKYKIKNEGENTYLILSEGESDYKYKKIDD